MIPVTRIPYLGKDMRAEKRVSVILVFLFGYIRRIPHLLLMRRGNNVAYMKNAWSVIVGVVNHDNLERQALVEIAGETTLLENEVSTPQLFGTFEDEDPENHKIWVRNIMTAIHTHDADTPDKLSIRLDWEHSEAAWIPVQDILKWLAGEFLDDPVARAILTEEEHTPDFEKHLQRIKSFLKELT